MANPVLLYSSAVVTLLHLIGVLYANGNAPAWIVAYMLTGCATSIWNHGTTSELAKWSDRGAMYFGTCATYWNTSHSRLYLALVPMIVAYVAAKRWALVEAHIAAHAIITLINLKILAEYR
jgi:hypothetical protein